MNYIIVIDQGTTSSRAIIFDEKSNISCLIFIEDGEYMFLTEDLEKEIYDFEE